MYIGDYIRFKHISNNIPKAQKINSSLLDIGCGNKIYKSLAENLGYSYKGIDINPVDEEVNKIDLNEEKQIIKLIDSKRYSIVLCVDVLEHLKNPLVTLSYLPDLINGHGKLLVHVPNLLQTHILVNPDKNKDHESEGFITGEIYNILIKFFKPEYLKVISTFQWNEAMAWDLNYIFSIKENWVREDLIEKAIIRLVEPKTESFVPYGILVIGER